MLDDWSEKILKGLLPFFLIGNTIKLIFKELKKK